MSEPQRKKFTEEVFDELLPKLQEIIAAVPELKAVGVVLAWEPGMGDNQSGLPFGTLMGQMGQIQSPDEIIRLKEQLWKMNEHLHRMWREYLEGCNGHAKELAERINTLQEELKGLNAEAGKRSPTDPGTANTG